MKTRFFFTYFLILISFLLFFPLNVSTVDHHDPLTGLELSAMFQIHTARNQKMMTQAIAVVNSMQSAPSCTRMAASHLMKECKHLENAPDFARSSPDPYLDTVKTEFAAKLAVCEILGAQMNHPEPPRNCDILVPSSKACDGGRWWTAKDKPQPSKKCYPRFKEDHYHACLKTLQSSPQYWTSFSNARQNAVVMCQASRNAIERENDLETFKNLTELIRHATVSLGNSVRGYHELAEVQKSFLRETRESKTQLQQDFHTLRETLLSSVDQIDDKFNSFMESSMSKFMDDLSRDQSTSLTILQREMQNFSTGMALESTQLIKHFNNELQQHHEHSLHILQAHHTLQLESYETLAGYMGEIHRTAAAINRTTGTSSSRLVDLANHLDSLSSKTERLTQGLSFLATIPGRLMSAFEAIVFLVAAISILYLIHFFNSRLARYAVGGFCTIYLFDSCGLYDYSRNLVMQIQSGSYHLFTLSDLTSTMTTRQQGTVILLFLWIGTYSLAWINKFFSRLLITICELFVGLRRVRRTGGQTMILPSAEMPLPLERKLHILDSQRQSFARGLIAT